MPDSVDWEVLVVDNNSNGRNRATAGEIVEIWPLSFLKRRESPVLIAEHEAEVTMNFRP
jgi:hypothetical protein